MDLHKDASLYEIDTYVKQSGPSPIDAWMTRWTFRHMLLKRAYTDNEFVNMAKQSRFGTCQIEASGIGLEVRFKRPAGVPALLVTLRIFSLSNYPNRKEILAILPFVNLTGDAGQEYLADGLTEEIIVQLERADPGHLQVIASAIRSASRGNQAQQVAEKVGAQYLLKGCVRRYANQIRISAKLERVHDRTYVWAKQYDRELLKSGRQRSCTYRDFALV